jgi:hypothetical protein
MKAMWKMTAAAVVATAALWGAQASAQEASTGAASAQAISGAVSAPKFAVGDTWTFSRLDQLMNKETSYTQKVTAVNGDGGVQVGSNITLSAAGNIVKSGAFSYSPEEVKLQFPMSVGQTYSAEYGYNDQSEHSWVREIDAKVEGVETVSTPAGDFQAFRVKITGSWHDKTDHTVGGVIDETMWYAPAAKRFVKDEYVARPHKGAPTTLTTTLQSVTVAR